MCFGTKVQKEREDEEELGRAEALRLAASVGDNAQVEMDSQYAAMLAERIAHEEVSESITMTILGSCDW